MKLRACASRTLSVLAFACALWTGLTSRAETKADDVVQDTNAVRIIVQPMVYNPVKWNSGDRLTVKVTFESDDGPTRVFGIATDVELVATKTYDNRWEMMLRSTKEDIANIQAAARLSEYCFTVTEFEGKHRKLVAASPSIPEFLKKNEKYRLADGTNWGLNARTQERLRVPTADELPKRTKQAEQTAEREPE